MLIYLSSPYRGDVKENTKLAQGFLRYAISKGHTPVAPHLLYTQILDDEKKEERALAMELNRDLISRVDELWVLAGKISEGMAFEIVEANRVGTPIRVVSRALVKSLLEPQTPDSDLNCPLAHNKEGI